MELLGVKERTFYFAMLWDCGVGGCYVYTVNELYSKTARSGAAEP